jgi:hypothetical protein
MVCEGIERLLTATAQGTVPVGPPGGRWTTHRFAVALAAAALAMTMCLEPVHAQDASARTSARALLILRILSYDHNLKKRAGQRVTVLVLYRAQDQSSLRVRDEVVESLTQVQRIKVAGLPISVQSAPFGDVHGLDARLSTTRPSAIFVCPGLESDIGAISAATRRGGVLSFSTSEIDVKRGLSVGILLAAQKHRILINVPAARAEGSRFDAGLLQLATLIGGDAP